jgi:aspartyl-tRNA(Asn)/glutamyl-tRNA(Gln) amidotransferase subunit C
VSTITREDVQRLARLARLELTDRELELFAGQLRDILEFARQIEAVDTASAIPLALPAQTSVNLRADRVRPSLPRDELLAGAPDPDLAAGLFKVPRVLNG